LRKTCSKLQKKEVEVNELKNELQRVSSICQQKVEQLQKRQSYGPRDFEDNQARGKVGKKGTLRHSDTQC
jgi:hypothetical protein